MPEQILEPESKRKPPPTSSQEAEWVPINLLAEALSKTERAMRLACAEKRYASRTMPNASGRGGRRRLEVLVSSLSTDELAALGRLAAPQLRELPSLLPFTYAPKWNQDIAEARADLLELVFGNGKRPEEALFLYDNDPAHAELRASLGRVTLRTLYRWKSAHQAGRLSALLTGYGQKGPRKLTPEMRRTVATMIWERWPRSTTSILRYLEHAFGRGLTYRTLHRYVTRYVADHHEALLHQFRHNEWRHTMMPSLGDSSAKALRPNHYWEADTTPADILCADGRRRKVIGIIDVYSRRAFLRLVDREDADAVAATLRACILAWALPENLLMDNGMVYHKSKHIRRICGELGIATPWLEVRAPEQKPHIERFFRTLTEQVFAELPGYTGNCLLTRPDEIKVEVEPERLQEIMDLWLEVDYHEREHSGTDQRPRERAQMPGWVAQMVDERELDLLLWHEVERVVSQAVCRYEGRAYYHPELPNGEQVTLKIDPADAGRVVVFWRGKFLCVALDQTARGLLPQAIREEKKARISAVKALVAAELRLAQPGPVEARLLERLEAQQEDVPAAFPQRGEVVPLRPYAEVLQDEPQAEQPAGEGSARRRPILWSSADEHYQWCIVGRALDEELDEDDLAFMAEFEQSELYAELEGYFRKQEEHIRRRNLLKRVNG
jgi:transposase